MHPESRNFSTNQQIAKNPVNQSSSSDPKQKIRDMGEKQEFYGKYISKGDCRKQVYLLRKWPRKMKTTGCLSFNRSLMGIRIC